MIKRLAILLLILNTLFSISFAQIYQIDKLYSKPDIKSQVSFVIPDIIKIYVLEKSGNWVQLQIVWDIPIAIWQYKGNVTGWIYLWDLGER